jgi:hypothetical protein
MLRVFFAGLPFQLPPDTSDRMVTFGNRSAMSIQQLSNHVGVHVPKRLCVIFAGNAGHE